MTQIPRNRRILVSRYDSGISTNFRRQEVFYTGELPIQPGLFVNTEKRRHESRRRRLQT